MGQVDLGLDLVFAASGAGRFRGSWRVIGASAETFANQFRLVLFQRTRMRFFLGNADFQKDVKNRLALDLQFPCQIVNSNLAHPLSFPPPCSR
jgi:hypothetical protein